MLNMYTRNFSFQWRRCVSYTTIPSCCIMCSERCISATSPSYTHCRQTPRVSSRCVCCSRICSKHRSHNCSTISKWSAFNRMYHGSIRLIQYKDVILTKRWLPLWRWDEFMTVLSSLGFLIPIKWHFCTKSEGHPDIRYHLISIGIPIVKIRKSHDYPIFL